MRLELFVNVHQAVASAVHRFTNLDVVVIPTELFIGLRARKELGAAKEEADTGN
jgi:hypothetical protein